MTKRFAGIAGIATSLVMLTVFGFVQVAFANHSVTELVSTAPSGGNGSFDVSRDFAISPDGSRSFFMTNESLVPGDTDNQQDVYERSNGTTTLVSTGPAGGNGAFPATLGPISGDGSHVVFLTKERLTSDDTDDSTDIYERSNGQTTLVSTGPAGGNGAFDVGAAYYGPILISRDGSRITFVTGERLTSNDTNDFLDVYQRSGGTTTLLSGDFVDRFFSNPNDMRVIGASPDGTRVFFETGRHLIPEDQDGASDVYEWANGTLTMDTVGANGENSGFTVFDEYLNADGTHLFFTTFARLSQQDTDSAYDLYDHPSGGTTRLVGTGPSAANTDNFSAQFRGASADGSQIFFITSEQLVPEDTNGTFDVYDRTNGTTTTLISTTAGGGSIPDFSTFVGASADGSIVFFQTAAVLTTDDTDGHNSIYRRGADGTITYVGTSFYEMGGLDRGFFSEGVSADGTRVFGLSRDPLVPSDTDGGCPGIPFEPTGCPDFYEYYAGQTTLLSTGPASTNGPYGVCEIHHAQDEFDSTYETCPFAFSEDGTRVLFRTNERLVSADTDSSFDVYSSSVATGPKRSDYRNASSFCEAERAFLGDGGFRKRYGTNGNGANAFGKCVSAN